MTLFCVVVGVRASRVVAAAPGVVSLIRSPEAFLNLLAKTTSAGDRIGQINYPQVIQPQKIDVMQKTSVLWLEKSLREQ